MRIGELGEQVDLSAKTIRYYEDIGIMPEPERTASGYRDYGGSARERLRFIKAAQAVGFTLGEIKEVLALGDRGEAPCMHVTQLMEDRIRSLSEHIRGLERMRSQLERLVAKAKRVPPSRGRSATSSRARGGVQPYQSVRKPSVVRQSARRCLRGPAPAGRRGLRAYGLPDVTPDPARRHIGPRGGRAVGTTKSVEPLTDEQALRRLLQDEPAPVR